MREWERSAQANSPRVGFLSTFTSLLLPEAQYSPVPALVADASFAYHRKSSTAERRRSRLCRPSWPSMPRPRRRCSPSSSLRMPMWSVCRRRSMRCVLLQQLQTARGSSPSRSSGCASSPSRSRRRTRRSACCGRRRSGGERRRRDVGWRAWTKADGRRRRRGTGADGGRGTSVDVNVPGCVWRFPFCVGPTSN